jgi:hypothetical protein
VVFAGTDQKNEEINHVVEEDVEADFLAINCSICAKIIHCTIKVTNNQITTYCPSRTRRHLAFFAL